ncbi:hypothetical protein Acsp02_85180 [Actinoplanes sp. NBRC 103695]|nr:hypothetical protein Acsp02_85180 [Actinoplanes sp. NBRC 103695]
MQAQAAELDTASLSQLIQWYRQKPSTMGWPGHTVHRFERRDVKIMIWDAPGQCDWWISSPDVAALGDMVQQLLPLSDLRASLWSTDAEGTALIRRARSNA